MDEKIWAFCKDLGGTGNLLPILPILRERGHEVRLFLHKGGKGQTVLDAAKVEYEVIASAEAVIEKYGYPKLLVTTMCSDGGAGRNLIPHLWSRNVRTTALQDFWGARIGTDFVDPMYHPDLVCVNDDAGVKIIKETWNTWKDDRGLVAPTGYPRLDALANFDMKAAAERGRELLGVKDDLPIVFYPGQVWHAGRTFAQITDALKTIGIAHHLVVSKHGRMTSETVPEEVKVWEEAEDHFKFQTLTDFSRVSDVLAISTVVVGQYSTTQVDAAVMGKPVISVLFPEYGAVKFQEETGGIMKEFPLVSLGCSVKAKDNKSLTSHLADALRGKLDMSHRQAEVFRLDGHNARRTAHEILALL